MVSESASDSPGAETQYGNYDLLLIKAALATEANIHIVKHLDLDSAGLGKNKMAYGY